MRDVDIAYLAGFIDGEGCISGHDLKRYCYIRVSVSQRRREVLDYLQEMMGMGNVSPMNGGKAFRWVISGQPAVKELLIAIMPFLQVKHKEAEVALALMEVSGREARLNLALQLKELKH